MGALKHVRFRCVTAAVVGAASLGIAGCGGNDEPAPVAVPSAIPPTESPRKAAEGAAQAAYVRFIEAWAKAGQTADPDAPELADYASGLAHKAVVSRMFGARQEGKVFKGSPSATSTVTGATPADAPTTVNLDGCLDGTKWLEYRKSDGKLWDDVPGGRHAMAVVVKRDGSVWKVDSFTMARVGTC